MIPIRLPRVESPGTSDRGVAADFTFANAADEQAFCLVIAETIDEARVLAAEQVKRLLGEGWAMIYWSGA